MHKFCAVHRWAIVKDESRMAVDVSHTRKGAIDAFVERVTGHVTLTPERHRSIWEAHKNCGWRAAKVHVTWDAKQ